MSKSDLKDLNNEAYADDIKQLREELSEWLKHADNASNYLTAMPCRINELSHSIYITSCSLDGSHVYSKEEIYADYKGLVDICVKLKEKYSGNLRYKKFIELLEHTVVTTILINGLADVIGYTGKDSEYACFGSSDPSCLSDADITFKALTKLIPSILGSAGSFEDPIE